MSKNKPDQAEHGAPGTSPEQESANTDEQTAPEPQQAAQDDAPTTQELAQQVEEYKDQALRAHAELENVRRRAQRDVEAARKFALEKFAADLLGVRDSLEMGLQAAQEEKATFKALQDGTELTLRMLATSMEKFGVEAIPAEGEKFNPDLHEAMTMQESDQHPPNSVVSVLQKGYQLNGRVLRPAMVVVSKAPSAGSQD